MAKQYLTVNGQLVMNNGKLIQVPDPDSINDLLDEQDGYATQLKQLSDDVSNLALNGLVDGTPRGSFQTLELLQTAYPDGAPGIYVITKTGEWCYYNEGWKIGGNYIEPDSGGGASITSNIKITGNKDDILGTTEHNKLCILSNTGDLSFKVVDKIEGGSEEISTLSEVLPQKISQSCCARHGENIYIFGGSSGGIAQNAIYKFNCISKSITTLSVTLPQALYGSCCAIYEDNIYIFGGSSGSGTNTIYKFNCTTETITTLSVKLPQAMFFSCCSTYNSNIYIFYLNTIYNFSISFELTANNVLIYNANSDYSFDLITDQVTIPIKKVYIGDSNNTAQLAEAYLYDESQTGWVNVNTGEVLS